MEKIDKHYDIETDYQDRVDFEAKLEPIGNRILHGAGQDQSGIITTFNNYVSQMDDGHVPCVTMAYVSSHHHIYDWYDTFSRSLSAYDDEKNYLLLQIGTHFNKDENPDEAYYDKIADGTMDNEIKALINMFKAFKRPIYLRPGFEFNGEWNGYTDPEIYVQAFRRFVTLVKECKADNIALLWCMNPDGKYKNFEAYYPGDNFVDWFALDVFRIGSVDDQITKDFLKMANEHNKPVMLTEVTPFTYSINKNQGWNEWFVPYFNFVKNNPVIKGTCFINWKWDEYPQWSNWGDSRLEEASEEIRNNYKVEINNPIYMNSASKEEVTKQLYGFKK